MTKSDYVFQFKVKFMMNKRLSFYLSKFSSEWRSFAAGTGEIAAVINYVDAAGDNDDLKMRLFLSIIVERNKEYFSLISKSPSGMGKEDVLKEVYLLGM